MVIEKPTYVVVNSVDLAEFVNDVNRKVEEGYTPLGAITTHINKYCTQHFTQALVLVPITTTL